MLIAQLRINLSVFLVPWIKGMPFGGDAKPAGLRFILFQLIFTPRVPAITTNPKLVALVVIKKIIYGT